MTAESNTPASSSRGQMERPAPVAGSWANSLLLSLLIVAECVVLGQLAFSIGLQDTALNGGAFFAEGLALAAAIFFGPRIWPGLLLGQFLLALFWSNLSLAGCLVVAVANTLENLMGGMLFCRLRISSSLSRPRSVVYLISLIVLLLQPISATGGLLAYLLSSAMVPANLSDIWVYWWGGNSLGQILVTALILAWFGPVGSFQRKAYLRYGLAIAACYIAPLLCFVVGEWGDAGLVLRVAFVAIFYITVIGVATRGSMRHVTLVNLLLSASFLAVINLDPYIRPFLSNYVRMFVVDVFLLAGVATSFLLASLMAEMARARRRLAEANEANERLLGLFKQEHERLMTIGDNLPNGAIYQLRLATDGTMTVPYISHGVERMLGIPAAEIMNDAGVLLTCNLQEEKEAVAAATNRPRELGEIFDLRFRKRTRDGEDHLGAMQAQPEGAASA